MRKYGQVVFECRVLPGDFQTHPGSLGNKYWPEDVQFDENFTRIEQVEWLVEEPNDILVTGLLLDCSPRRAERALVCTRCGKDVHKA